VERVDMRALVVTIIMLGATLGVLAPSAQAQSHFRFGGARSGAWCLFYDPWTYDCGFATLQQCLATSSGVGGQCQPNPSGPPTAPRGSRQAPRS
jgi:hypothetical protein